MAENTPNLGLYKKDPVADRADTFNIQSMLNDNWDKLDAFSKENNAQLSNKANRAEIEAHDENPLAHEAVISSLTNLVNEALAKVQVLWDTIYADITGNPYLVTFGDLTGLVVEGVWNVTQQRIEF